LPPGVVSGGRWSRTNSRGVSGRAKPFVSSCRRARLQSVQWELNPHDHVGNVAGCPYIMDADGPRASPRSHELPDSNRLLQSMESGAEPNQQVCTLRTSGAVASSGGWARTSGLRVFSATLSPAELHRNVADRDASRSRTCLEPLCRRSPGRPALASRRASGGTRTHALRLTRTALGLSSCTGVLLSR
jgi:hypothetical protein